MSFRDTRFKQLDAEFKLEVLGNHYLGAYEEGLSEDDDLYIELLNDPKKLEQTLKDEFGGHAESIINTAWYNYSMYGYM